MSFTESTVEAAALECFGELGLSVGHGPHRWPGELAAEPETLNVGVVTQREVK